MRSTTPARQERATFRRSRSPFVERWLQFPVLSADWKRSADADRKAGDERSLALRREFLIGRGTFFDWKVPANDNKAWPLAAQLRKEGRDAATAEIIEDTSKDLLSTAERYVAVYDAASAPDPLVGVDYEEGELPLVQNGDGDRHKGAKRIAGAPIAGDACYRAVPLTANDGDPPMRRARPVPKKWNGDALLIGRMDARKDLGRIRGSLGPLVDAFELAVLHGETLTAIGEIYGIGQAAGGAGKALVYLALEAAKHEFALIDTERAASTYR